MRHLIIAVGAIALFTSITGSASAGTGHWYCTTDGIKSWTMDAGAKDAHGWSFVGDSATYKTDGHCAKQ